MIKAIHMKSCVPYQQAEITDCKKINFIFGSNGCGKTTVSSFLSGVSNSRFAACTVDWESENHESVYVYNKWFRRNNFQQTIPGVFTLGSATIEDINNLEKIKRDLAQKRKIGGRSVRRIYDRLKN